MTEFNDFLKNIHYGYSMHEVNGVVYFSSPEIDKLGLYNHGFTSRIGGITEKPYDSLNLSFSRCPSRENTIENLKIACKAMDIDFDTLVLTNYCHGNNVELIDRNYVQMGITRETELPFCDGIITEGKDASVLTLHSDCSPIVFADKYGRACGSCHSGWKGTYLDTVKSIVEKMESIGISRNDILFGVGPTISPDNYEIKMDCAENFMDRYSSCIVHRDEKMFLNLPRVILQKLFEQNIPAENVTFADLCTYNNEKYFFSHRRNGKNAGAMGSLIGFKE